MRSLPGADAVLSVGLCLLLKPLEITWISCQPVFEPRSGGVILFDDFRSFFVEPVLFSVVTTTEAVAISIGIVELLSRLTIFQK